MRSVDSSDYVHCDARDGLLLGKIEVEFVRKYSTFDAKDSLNLSKLTSAPSQIRIEVPKPDESPRIILKGSIF